MLHKKWKYFTELFREEKVATLNQETGEKEWQLPYEKQEFEHNEEMYSIKTIDSEGKEGELVVSPEHKVYVSKKVNFFTLDNQIQQNNNQEFDYAGKSLSSFSNSSVDTKDILPFNIFLNSGSCDQILTLIPESLYLNANATYGKSSLGLISLDSSINVSYSSFGIVSIFSKIRNKTNHSLDNSNLEYLSNFSSFLLTSSNMYSGVTNLYPFSFNNLIKSNVNPLLINEAKITSASTINNFIFYKCISEIAELTSLPSSTACSFVNSLSFNISLANENFISSCICLNNLSKSCLALFSNPSGTSILSDNSAILTDNSEGEDYLRFAVDAVGEEFLSNLIQDKARGLDSSERNYIDDEESESSRRKTEAS